MKTLFVIRNQNNHYLGKQGQWVDGSHRPALFRSEHRDVALNELFEVNIRDFDLRGELISVEMDDKRLPVVEVLNPIEVVEPVDEAPEEDVGAAQSEDAEGDVEDSSDADDNSGEEPDASH